MRRLDRPEEHRLDEGVLDGVLGRREVGPAADEHRDDRRRERPDQLLVYALVQGDERVIVEFAPIGPNGDDQSPFAPRQLAFDTSDYVQMELLGMDTREEARGED